MRVLNRSQLILGLIRCAERFPDRIGLPHCRKSHDCTDHCILGQIDHDLGECDNYGFSYDGPEYFLACWAAQLNNAGVPWGEIPKRMGLVPGETPLEIPAEVCS